MIQCTNFNLLSKINSIFSRIHFKRIFLFQMYYLIYYLLFYFHCIHIILYLYRYRILIRYELNHWFFVFINLNLLFLVVCSSFFHYRFFLFFFFPFDNFIIAWTFYLSIRFRINFCIFSLFNYIM